MDDGILHPTCCIDSLGRVVSFYSFASLSLLSTLFLKLFLRFCQTPFTIYSM